MNGRGIRIGRFFGIPVELNITWFLVVLLIAWTFAEGVFLKSGEEIPVFRSTTMRWLFGFLTALLLFGSVFLHELSHSYVAKRLGIPVRRITLFMFGGVAQLQEEPRSPKVEFLVAIAGPACSLTLAAASYGLLHIIPARLAAFRPVFWHLAIVNIFVLAFNLVPGFPLDGGRVLRSFIWAVSGNFRLSTLIASAIGRGFAIFLIVFGISIPLLFGAGRFLEGVWLIMIGFFLYQAAEMGYLSALYPHLVHPHKLGEYIDREEAVLHPDDTLSLLADKASRTVDTELFLVTEGDRIEGVVDIRELLKKRPDEWSVVRVGEVMRSDVPLCHIGMELNILDALRRIAHSPGCYILLTENDRPLKVLSTKDIARFLAKLKDAGIIPPKV